MYEEMNENVVVQECDENSSRDNISEAENREDFYGLQSEFSENSSSEDEFLNVEEDQNIPEYNIPPEVEKLREWGQRINQNDLDDLLRILRERLLPTLPKSSKTFLRTVDARYNIIEMDDIKGRKGEFVYFSVKESLKEYVNPALHENNLIELQVNCDGIPLSKSSDRQFWVTSAKVHFYPDIYDVFPVCIFLGQSKPKNAEEYLEKLIEEINELNREGVTIEGKHFQFKLKCFICDTPARSFLKCTLGHGGKEACERCEVVGERVERRTVYPCTEAVERTDESFRNFRQLRHHHGPSPLFQILPHINMVLFFILDFMHLFCCGIMKKLLEYWMNGDLNCRLSVGSRLELGRRLEYIKLQIPDEFQRKTRSITFLAKCKATEFRFFLLYCGPIVLKNLLPKKLYDHFLLLHVAARILCCKSLLHTYNTHAKYTCEVFSLL